MNEHKRFWKCEACDGWFDLGTMLDREQPLPVDVGIECTCPDPNVQQRLVLQEATPLNAIDRVMRACQSTADEVSRIMAVSQDACRHR